MIARRLCALARAMAAISNGEHIDKVDVLEYVPAPLRRSVGRWVDAGVMATIHTAEAIEWTRGAALRAGFTLKRLAERLRGDDD